MDSKFTYLIINLFTISYPLAQSFEHRLRLYKKWYALFPAILITGSIFILWDILKTHFGVWSFNPKFLVGIDLINLPIEEWMFFITVPYACIFIYEVLNYFFSKDLIGRFGLTISKYLGIFLLIIGLINFDKTYTVTAFSMQGLFLIVTGYFFKPDWFGRFLLAYFVSLIPFLIVNGLLTSLPVVIYNNEENLNFRIFTIPVEDTIYSMMLFLMNVSIYELLMKKRSQKSLIIK